MKKLLSFLLLVFIIATAFAGCLGANENNQQNQTQPPTNDQADPNNGLSAVIEVAGSTSVQPLAQSLADEFKNLEPGLQINIQGLGSSQGIKAANDGVADIGTSSRELKEEEKSWGLTEHIIAKDGIAVIVNPTNPVQELTKDQIAKIFKGEITNWSELGGTDNEIIVISREAGSGTRGAFEEILGIEDEVREDALIQNSNGAIKTDVSNKKNAIGYISLGYVDESVVGVKVDGVDASSENVQNGSYAISRSFLMVTKGEVKAEVQAFLDFIMSDEGQKIVAEEYIPVK